MSGAFVPRVNALELAGELDFDDFSARQLVAFLKAPRSIVKAGVKGVLPKSPDDPQAIADVNKIAANLVVARLLTNNGLGHTQKLPVRTTRQRVSGTANLICVNAVNTLISRVFRPVSRATEPPSNAPDGGSPILLLGG